MSIQLRPYQQQAVDQIRAAYKNGFTCPLLRLDTGGGKTVIFSYITQNSDQRGNSVMVVAHRQELIRQISLSLARFGVTHALIAAPSVVSGIKVAHFKAFGRIFVNPASPTMVGSVQTITRRLDKIPHRPKLIIMDEGHHVVEQTQWGDVMQHYHDALGLIVTATPERLDGKGLGSGEGGFADTMIEVCDMAWLIENGYLSPYRVFTTSTQIDLTGIRTTKKGDWKADELASRVDKPSLLGDAVEHYKRVAMGMRAVAYCANVEHSEHTAAAFRAAGIPAAHFDGTTDDKLRQQIINDYALGKLLVLCNCSLVVEGFDLASVAQMDVTIDCVIDLAPTKSLSLYLQKAGRALRPYEGKTAIILDHAGNVTRHGLPDMARNWSLDGRKKGKRAANDNEPAINVRTCPQCFAIHAPEPTCPVCAFVYPAQTRTLEQAAGQLVELSSSQKAAIKAQAEAEKKAASERRKIENRKAQTLEDLVQLGKDRGYKFPKQWAEKQFAIKQEYRQNRLEGMY